MPTATPPIITTRAERSAAVASFSSSSSSSSSSSFLKKKRSLHRLKQAILRLPRDERAAFTYAYQRDPRVVQQVETPPLRYLEAAAEGEEEEKGDEECEDYGMDNPHDPEGGRKRRQQSQSQSNGCCGNRVASAAVPWSLSNDEGDSEDDDDNELAAQAAARQVCNYWRYKWMLFCASSLWEENSKEVEHQDPRECRRLRLLRPLSLASLTARARDALLSGFLTVLPDVRIVSSNLAAPSILRGCPEEEEEGLMWCPVVCFRADRWLHCADHYDRQRYLQSAFYFWNVLLCRERWRLRQQQQAQQQHDNTECPHGAHDACSSSASAASAASHLWSRWCRRQCRCFEETTTTRYVGLICVDPTSILDETVQAWVDAALACSPVNAHSLHVLASTTATSTITSNTIPPRSSSSVSSVGTVTVTVPTPSTPAHFYGVTLPRTIKVFGKLLRDQGEVQVHVRDSHHEFASVLSTEKFVTGGGGSGGARATTAEAASTTVKTATGEAFRLQDLPDFLGGELPLEAWWHARLADQARREGTALGPPSTSSEENGKLGGNHDSATRTATALHDNVTDRSLPLPTWDADVLTPSGEEDEAIARVAAEFRGKSSNDHVQSSCDVDGDGGGYMDERATNVDALLWWDHDEAIVAAGSSYTSTWPLNGPDGEDRDIDDVGHSNDDDIDMVSLLRFFHDHDEQQPALPVRPTPPLPPDPAADDSCRLESVPLCGEMSEEETVPRGILQLTLQDALRLLDEDPGALNGSTSTSGADLVALRDAVKADAALVERESPWMLFLMNSGGGESAGPRRALDRLGRYWKLRRELFGRRAHFRPMTVTGEGAMGRKEIAFIRSSECIQWLPRDAAGRSVLYLDAIGALGKSKEAQLDRSVLLRCLFYAFHVIMSDQARELVRNASSSSPEHSIQAGVVVLCPDRTVSQVALPFDVHGPICCVMNALWEAFPIFLTSIHLFITDPTSPRQDQLFSECNRRKLYHLYGFQPQSANEVWQLPSLFVHSSSDALDQHGLKTSNLPASMGGRFSRAHFLQWLELRVRLEWDIPAGSRNKETLDMFDFSHVRPVQELEGDELRERRRRMNILHTRRKRDREQAEDDLARDRSAALRAENDRLRDDNSRLERLLRSARQLLASNRLPDPSLVDASCELIARLVPKTTDEEVGHGDDLHEGYPSVAHTVVSIDE